MQPALIIPPDQESSIADGFELGSGPKHVLLVHGFTGGTREIYPLAEALAPRGLHVHGLRLTGHGSDVERLAETTAEDWRRDVLRAIERIGEPLAVVGLSMGAMLAAIAGAERPLQVQRLVLLAPALQLAGTARLFLWASHLAGLPLMPRYLTKQSSDIADPEVRATHHSVSQVPLCLGAQFARVAEWGRSALPKVQCPTLVIGAVNDHTVPFTATQNVFTGLATPHKRFIRLERSFHLMTIDVERDAVADATYEWTR